MDTKRLTDRITKKRLNPNLVGKIVDFFIRDGSLIVKETTSCSIGIVTEEDPYPHGGYARFLLPDGNTVIGIGIGRSPMVVEEPVFRKGSIFLLTHDISQPPERFYIGHRLEDKTLQKIFKEDISERGKKNDKPPIKKVTQKLKRIISFSLLISLFVLITFSPHTIAIEVEYETVAVSRIVGESPTELLRQLQPNSINIQKATWYTYDLGGGVKSNLLKKQFGDGVSSNWGFILDLPLSYSFPELSTSLNRIRTNELVIIETQGSGKPLSAGTSNGDLFFPADMKSWQGSIEENHPLLVFDSPYSGVYLPKVDTFISRLVRDTTIIAPTSFNSPQFSQSFLCQLWNGKNVGKVFRDARNFHYLGGSQPNPGNFIGLVLQSYALFGNPLQLIKMDWDEADFQKIKKQLCHNNLDNLESGMEYLGQVGNYSKFRKYIIFSIDSLNTIDEGGFSLLNASNTFLGLAPGELALPMAVRTTYFPLQTIITNFSLVEVKGAEDITLSSLPSYLPLDENSFTDRACFEEYQNFSISFANAYTEDSQRFIAEIHPVEVRNCTTGALTVYKFFNYSVEFIAVSPVLIKSVSYPATVKIDQEIGIDIELMKLSQEDINGSLMVFDQNNNKLVEEEMVGFAELANASFYAPPIEGAQAYSIEYVYNGSTVALKKIPISVTILEVSAEIPSTVPASPSISLDFFSYFQSDFTLNAKYYLIDNDSTMQSGEFTMAMKPGSNQKTLSFSGLNRSDQSYTLSLSLSYLNSQKSASFLLVTNNIPLIVSELNQSAMENEAITLTVAGIDIDNDSLTLEVEDEKFLKRGPSYRWDTDFGDSGNYSINISASDGFVTSTKQVSFEVRGTPNLALQRAFRNGDATFNAIVSPAQPIIASIPLPKDAMVLSATSSLRVSPDTGRKEFDISSFDDMDNKTYTDGGIDNKLFTLSIEDKANQLLNISFAESRLDCQGLKCILSLDTDPEYSISLDGKEICRSQFFEGIPSCIGALSIDFGEVSNGDNTLMVYQRAPGCCNNQQPIDQIRLENPRGYITRAQASTNIQLSVDTANDSSIDLSYDEPNSNIFPKSSLNASAINDFLDDCKEDENNTCLVPIIFSSSTGAELTLSSLKIAYLPKNGTLWNYSLRQGWNMVSFPFELSRKDLNEGPFRTFPANCTEKLIRYNASTKELKGWDNSQAGWNAAEGGTILEETYGYWIKVGEDCRIAVRGKAPLQRNISLSAGWNLVGFPSQDEAIIGSAITDVKGSLNGIMLYENGTWLSYYPERPAPFNTLSYFEPGKSYWIRINGTGQDWIFLRNESRFIVAQLND
ncbi:hypothetical protein HYU13_03145 [Candidatus Woesearchaeota archaeon]|nr:hypothetical protein [Candidatus Woesearchaeota archaeon]